MSLGEIVITGKERSEIENYVRRGMPREDATRRVLDKRRAIIEKDQKLAELTDPPEKIKRP